MTGRPTRSTLFPYTTLFRSAKKKKVKQFAKVSSIVIVLFFSNTFIYKEALHLWEIPAVNKSEVEYHDVGIVLGGMFEYDNSVDRLSIRRGGDRIWQAIDLYKSKKISKICIVGKHEIGRAHV